MTSYMPPQSSRMPWVMMLAERQRTLGPLGRAVVCVRLRGEDHRRLTHKAAMAAHDASAQRSAASKVTNASHLPASRTRAAASAAKPASGALTGSDGTIKKKARSR